MNTYRLLALFGAPLTATLGCQPSHPYDHYWSAEHCAVSFDSTTDWSGMNVARPVQASAYLRRANGASSLLVQLDGYGHGIAEPYPSAPTLRFAIPPGSNPGALSVVIDASDLRGPTVVPPGTAWLIDTPATDPSKPEDGWRFGSGALRVETLAYTENDTSERNFVTLDAAFDLSGVTVAPLAGQGEPAGGKLRLRCADEALVAVDGGVTDAGADAGDGGGGAPDAGADADAGPSACGTSGSCGNSACADCDGEPTTFCEVDLRTSDHCGSCGRSCGPSATCDPSGACAPELVASDMATAVAIGTTGVGYLGPSVGVRFVTTGGTTNVIAPAGSYSPQDAIAIEAGDLYFASNAGLSRASLPVSAPVGVAGAIQPGSVRLIGLTATHVYALTLNEQNAYDVVRRYDRTAYAPELVACLPLNTYDAAVSASGAVFVSTGSALMRYDNIVGGSSCNSTSSSALLASATPPETIVRVVAGSTRVFYGLSGVSGTTVLAMAAGGGSATTLGDAAPAPGAGPLPLAADGDTPFWIARPPTPTSGSFVVSGSGGPTTPFAVTSQAVVSLAASPAGVAWIDASGVRRTPR